MVLCILAGFGGGYYAGHSGTKEYQATTQCIVNVPSASTLAQQFTGVQITNNFVTTYAELASSRAVAAKVVASLGLRRTPASVAGELSATTQPNSYVINISATDPSPAGSAALANAAAQGLKSTVAALQAGVRNPATIQVVDPATVPVAPTSSGTKVDLILGIVLGALVGLGLVAMLEALDRSVRSTSEAAALFRAPVLAAVPRRRSVVRSAEDGQTAEPYRILRNSLRFMDIGRPLKTVAITSPSARDGKTRTVANLATALAAAGETVTVVDADLRRGELAGVFGATGPAGLTSVLMGTATLAEALQTPAPGVQLLSSGPLPSNPAELLGSERFTEILRELAVASDMVLVDSPPVVPVADAVALASSVDAVIIVVRYARTHRQAVQEAARRLTGAKAYVIGYVLNAVARGEQSSSYARESDAEIPAALPMPSQKARKSASARLRR